MAYGMKYDTLIGYRANSTGLATSQFKYVKVASTAGQCVLSGVLNTTTGPGLIGGVLQNKPGGSEEAEIAYSGICKMLAATSTIAVGDRVGVDSTSRATDAATTDNIFHVGRALTAAGAAGDIITVMLIPGGSRY